MPDARLTVRRSITALDSPRSLGASCYVPPLRWLAGTGDGPPVTRAAHADHWLVDHGGAEVALQEGHDADLGLGWRSDGHWTFGAFEVREHDLSGDALQQLSRRLYTRLFQVIGQAGTPHLVRLWNYLPAINAPLDGLERYRHFNLGRQQAFFDAARSAFDGAPAACALGCGGHTLRVYFLAGRTPVTAVENPRQVSAYRYPQRYGPAAPTFSRAALADLGGGRTGLFISGTASIVGHETVHHGDVRAQTRETVTNLRAVCDEAGATAGQTGRYDIAQAQLIVYVRQPDDAPAVREELAGALGPHSTALRCALFVQADVCRADLLMEIEAHLLPD